jgi:hypothetical protein
LDSDFIEKVKKEMEENESTVKADYNRKPFSIAMS